jgi:hypothetical protein
MKPLNTVLGVVSALIIPGLPLSAQPPARLAGPGAPITPTWLAVTDPACHLQQGQVIQFIGPINANGDYILVLHDPNNPGAPHWVPGVYTAVKLLPNQDLYLLETRAKAPPTQHPDEAPHSAVMNITEKSGDTPDTVDIVCPPHSLGGGAHGGTAHLQ